MAVATNSLDIETLSPVLGARIHGLDLTADIAAQTQVQLRAAFARYGAFTFKSLARRRNWCENSGSPSKVHSLCPKASNWP